MKRECVTEGKLFGMTIRVSLLVLVCATVGFSAGAQKKEKNQPPADFKVGVTSRVFHPKAPRNWRGAQHQELQVTVWYPAAENAVETQQMIGAPDAPLFLAGKAAEHAAMAPALEARPLIVLSHGTGGSAMQMAWLGTALARAGFIAAAVNHPGNNALEPYTAEGFVLWWERATDLSEVIDGMLADSEFGPKIDKDRIGAAGFSIGGYTVLALGGARADISVLLDLCKQKPDTVVCHVPEMKEMGTPDQMLAAARKTSGASLASSNESYQDPRVRAIFAIAPAVGMTLTHESLHSMRVPVHIVVGSADPIATPKDNADLIRSQIRGAKETVLPNVAHYTFLDACTAGGKQQLGVFCVDPPGVDREAVHAQVDEMAVEFFGRELRVR
jgi:predicted dienelactone hydrolase